MELMNPSVTMSSLELVAFINDGRQAGAPELRHDSFMAKVPKVLGESAQNFLDTYIHPQNSQKYLRYLFPKREACLMAMSYSYELQAKVFDRMTALEALQAPRFQVPNTLAGALRLAAEQAEAIEQQSKLIEQQKPAVEFVDRFVNIKSSKSITEVAKILGVGQREFFEWLAEKKIIYKRSDNWLPASTYAKYFDVKIKQVSETKEVSQSRFVPAGIVWIATKWTKEKTQLSLGL